jgi:hypothetical protein
MEPSEELRMFFQQRLLEKGFTEEQVDIISTEYKAAEQEEGKAIGREILALIKKLSDNPDVIKGIFGRRDVAKYVFDGIIATLVISALLLLAHWSVIDKTQAGTILGGIVGYLLGNTSKN